MGITTIFLLLGGLGLFLFGMKLMSDGLEQVAGARMRSILEFFTKNRFVGMLVGILFTAVVQSSSATTVLVVSFVNSGLMNLFQAAGVILGANIGTTVTGQLIAFNLSDVAPLFVIIGVVMFMFCNKQNVKKIGVVILGFGILFMGLSTMSGAMSSFRESPEVVSLLGSLTNPLMAILVGFVMASQGLLAFPICFFLILGCNMGSCVSALLASIGGKKDAKRAAWIHFLFNIIGSFVIFLILTIALDPIADGILALSKGNVSRAVANAHTLIKICEVFLLFPFMGWVVKATYRIVPGEDGCSTDAYELKYIQPEGSVSPATAVVDGIHELQQMGELAMNNLKMSMEALCEPDEKKIKEVCEQEAYIDFLNRQITDYLVKISELDLPIADAKILGGLFHVVNDIERIGDHAENFAEAAKERMEKQIPFSEKAIRQIREMAEMVTEVLDYALQMFSERSTEHMKEVLQLEEAVDQLERKLQKAHVKRLTKGKCTPEASMLYSDAISGLERAADHATNIAFAILEPEDLSEEEEE